MLLRIICRKPYSHKPLKHQKIQKALCRPAVWATLLQSFSNPSLRIYARQKYLEVAQNTSFGQIPRYLLSWKLEQMCFLFAFVMLINFFLGIWYFLCWINLLSLPLLRGTLFTWGWKLVCTRTKQLIYSSLIPALGYINIILSYIAHFHVCAI
jgi:hypothetical protein